MVTKQDAGGSFNTKLWFFSPPISMSPFLLFIQSLFTQGALLRLTYPFLKKNPGTQITTR